MVWVRDEFAGPGNPAGTIPLGVLGKRQDQAFDPLPQRLGRRLVEPSDVTDEPARIIECACTPPQRQHHSGLLFRRAAAIVARTRAIASSWGTLARVSAKLPRTLARNQRSYASASSVVANSEIRGESSAMAVL